MDNIHHQKQLVLTIPHVPNIVRTVNRYKCVIEYKIEHVYNFIVQGAKVTVIVIAAYFVYSENARNTQDGLKEIAISAAKHKEVVSPTVQKTVKKPIIVTSSLAPKMSTNDNVKVSNEGVTNIIPLPKFDRKWIDNGKIINCTIEEQKKYFLTNLEFKQYCQEIKGKFDKVAEKYQINSIVETARHTYECWRPFQIQQKQQFLLKGKIVTRNITINGWIPSGLFIYIGNASGIKWVSSMTDREYALKVDDKQNCFPGEYPYSRFVKFKRESFYDTDDWMKFHCTRILQNGNYRQAAKNRTNMMQYSYSFKRYSTREDYCEILYKRALLIKEMVKDL